MLGIIGAMPEEISLVLENMNNIQTQDLGQTRYYKGMIGNTPVVLCQSGIGKVNSALAAAALIYVYQVDSLVFTGVAGGVYKDIKLGDLVIGTDFLYHDFDATAIGYQLSQIPDDNEKSIFYSDSALSQKFTDLAIKLLGQERVFRGRIVSGDDFVASSEKIDKLRVLFDAYAVDMESAPIAHVANKCNIPCCVIRSISDKADGVAAKTYSGFFREAAIYSAKLVTEFCKNYS
ncbi:MAG: 5'-methylthioadenosine/adenosylhomocysteine nucleosidase [Brevinema sp.]